MSSILIDPSGNINSAVYEPGTQLSYNQDGTITGKAILNIKRANASSGLPALGTVSEFDSRAYVSDREIVWEEATAKYILSYSGVWNTSLQKVEGFASSQQKPIDQCPTFDLLSNTTAQPATTSPGAGAVYSNGAFVAFIPGALDTLSNAIGAVQSFYGSAGATIRITSASATSSDVTSLLSNIGKIFNSVTAGSITLSGTYIAICTSVNWEETYMTTNSVFRITQEFNYDPNGFLPTIYPH